MPRDKQPTRSYRQRRYRVKWHLRDQTGKPLPRLGWLFQVSRRGETVRILPEDLEVFNKALTECGRQPVDGEWTCKVNVARLTDKTDVTADPPADPSLRTADALGHFCLSPQNQIAQRIHEYWRQTFSDRSRFLVLTDQGSKWMAAKGSDARVGISLYTDGDTKSRGNWMTRADNAVFDTTGRMPPYLVEIEASRHIKPKVPAGLIGITNTCRWSYPTGKSAPRRDLTKAVLFVVLCSSSLADPNSRKLCQTEEFRKWFKPGPGCLGGWHICLGATPDAAFSDFQQQFESLHRTSANSS